MANYPNILERCEDWLTDNGLRPRIDEDNDLVFKYQMLNFVIIWSEEDPAFLRILLPVIWSIDNEAEAQQVLVACNKVNLNRKVIKTFTTNNNTFMSVEMLVQEDFDPAQILERSLEMLTQGYQYFAQEMRGQQN
ncbi:MAG: YbjN domain-containing protein [Muribaculaceae bacterium]|nr:YbjN domain-containing protein [Muribaculaceae bacterium]